ncbi:MAG TPA: alpha/beta hydrolase [Dongiaceae bacterium]|jgi:pimeloyl-ACP methyl ester carboxylesterase|nr:alpha/beta hydrolase [Dongiaceae bacterium]
MTERVIRADGVELASQTFGDRRQSAVLLIMGVAASMLWWPDAFCTRLAQQGRYVVRYDNRDTGLSTAYPPGEPPYTSDDMVDDAIRILDGYPIPSAHVVGMSMGGALAQLVALKHPTRTASLTVISSSPIGEDTSALPGASAAYRAHAAQFEQVDWTDRAQVVRMMIAESRVLAGSAHPFDEAGARRLVERDFDRARNFASATNHFVLKGPKRRYRLSGLQAPLLVIHGTADPLFPIEHGIAVAETVPDATLVRLRGGGHELHEADWDEIIAAIVAHTARQRT